MEGVARQLQLLHTALQPLDFRSCRAEDDSVVSELQASLAHATALAQWAAIRQQRLVASHDKASQATKERPTRNQRNSGAQQVETDALDDAPAHRTDETLVSVAAALRVSVADLRRWNPHLPRTLRDKDVLPPNTYVKVRQAAAATSSTESFQRSSAPAAQTVPRLAAPASTSRSSVRSSGGRSSEQPNTAAASSATPAPPPTRAAFSNVGIAASSLPANFSVNASVSSALSGSMGRASLWTGESGRGASRSPQVPEPSMSGGYSSADPPCCAPAPIMVGLVEVASSRADDAGGCPADEFYLPGEAPSPSPERQSGTIGVPEVPRDALPNTSSPLPQMQKLVASPSPTSAHEPLPSSSSQQELNIAETGAGSPRRASAGASSSGTSAREIRTRGRSQSPSATPTALSVETPCVSTPQRSGVDSATVAPTATSPSAAAKSDSSSGAAVAVEKANLSPSVRLKTSLQRMAPDALADALEGSASASCKEGEEGGEVLRRHGRDFSGSLSALSPATSIDDEQESARGPASHDPKAEAGQHQHQQQQQPPSPPQVGSATAAAAAVVHSPSLEAPSSASSVSPRGRAAREPPPPPQQQQHNESKRATLPSSSSIDATGPGFSTPLQQRRRQPPPQGTAAVDPSCSPVSPSTYSSSSSHAGSDESGSEGKSDPSSFCSGEDFNRDETEDTPSTRIPAMLGRHACNPPPMLSRTRRTLSTGAGPAANTNAKVQPVGTQQVVSAASPSSPTSQQETENEEPTAPAALPSATPTLAQQPASSSPSSSKAEPPRPPTQSDDSPERQLDASDKDVNPAFSLSPVPFRNDELMDAQGLRKEEGAEDNGNVEEEDNGEEEEDDYDTLEGIAAAYKITVATIVEWNPYLKKYDPNEPLPPDLPIVLPMSGDDEDEGEEGEVEEGEGIGHDAEGDEDELYAEANAREQLRHSSTPLDTVGFTPDNSPAPIPPPRF